MLETARQISLHTIRSPAGQFVRRNIAIIAPIAIIALGLIVWNVYTCIKNRKVEDKTKKSIPELGDTFAKQNFKLSEIKEALNLRTDTISEHFANIKKNIDRADLEALATNPKSEKYAIAAAIYLALESDCAKRLAFVQKAGDTAGVFLHLFRIIEVKVEGANPLARDALFIDLLKGTLKSNTSIFFTYLKAYCEFFKGSCIKGRFQYDYDSAKLQTLYSQLNDDEKTRFIIYSSDDGALTKLINTDKEALKRAINLHFAGDLKAFVKILKNAELDTKTAALTLLEEKGINYKNLVAISKFSDLYPSFNYNSIVRAWKGKKPPTAAHFALAIPKCSNEQAKSLYNHPKSKHRVLLACLESRKQQLNLYTCTSFKLTGMMSVFSYLTIHELQPHLKQIRVNIDRVDLNKHINTLYVTKDFDKDVTITPYVLAMLLEEDGDSRTHLVTNPNINSRYIWIALNNYCTAIGLENNNEIYTWIANFTLAQITHNRQDALAKFIEILDLYGRFKQFYDEHPDHQAAIKKATPKEIWNEHFPEGPK